MQIPDQKRELLRSCAALALHDHTPANEADAAARGFFRILKSLKVSPEDLLRLGPPRMSPRAGAEPSPGRPFFGFGKYQGLPIEAVPTSYLIWVLDNLSKLNPRMKREIAREVDNRRRR